MNEKGTANVAVGAVVFAASALIAVMALGMLAASLFWAFKAGWSVIY